MSGLALRRRKVLCKRTSRSAEEVSYEFSLYELPRANDRPADEYGKATSNRLRRRHGPYRARGSAAPKLAKRGLRPAPDQVCYLPAYRIGDRHLRESVPDALGHFYQPLPDQGLSELCVIGQFLEIS